MATCLFRSSLAFRLQSFLETRRAAGREDAATQKILIYLDRFLMSELKAGKPLTRGRLIHVREAKFKKSRYVPISQSAADHLAGYLHRRRKAGFPTSSTSPVFVGPRGGNYGKSTIATIFLETVRKIGIRGPKGQRGPRIHDFRHTFAVNRLLTWHREGTNLFAKLPLLSTYLGHTSLAGTEVYLHATAELLESVGKRFHSHFAIPVRSGRERHGKN
jgi:integrase/recombinase XerD